MDYKYLFGPVPSRRLGISLGIDLIPFKTCSLNCIYCECGKTNNFTMTRKEYIPLNELFDELNNYLKNKPNLDYITFSGSGEPTLHSGLGKVTDFLKNNYPDYKSALLTNGSLLSDKELQNEIKNIDLVIPSLDAVSEDVFKKINRPCKTLRNRNIINGLIDFSKNFKGKIWIEIFIVPGINDTEAELKKFKEVLNKINHEKIQLNSLDRPGAEKWVKKADEELLNKIKDYLKPLNVEIVSKFSSNKITDNNYEDENKILSLIKRRPCTVEDIILSLNTPEKKAEALLKSLLDKNLIEITTQKRGQFYKIKKN